MNGRVVGFAVHRNFTRRQSGLSAILYFHIWKTRGTLQRIDSSLDAQKSIPKRTSSVILHLHDRLPQEQLHPFLQVHTASDFPDLHAHYKALNETNVTQLADKTHGFIVRSFRTPLALAFALLAVAWLLWGSTP